ncbi:MAG: hypothetical protein NZ839_02145 [Endomicrobia bacterium]|nr:hypothetical protein [Endomicrobiia bacterium]
MVVISLLFGLIVILTHPEYRVNKVYETNKNYYPQINDVTVKEEFQKLFNTTDKKLFSVKKSMR